MSTLEFALTSRSIELKASPRKRDLGMHLAQDILGLRDRLAPLDPVAAKFGFCDRGVELANSIAAHDGEAPWPLRRKARQWLHEADQRFEVWQAVHSRQVLPSQPRETENA